MPTCPPPRSTPAPTPKPNAKPSRAPTSRSPPNPWPTGQQTKISSHGSTASASNTIGLCGRNRHARLCYQRRCCCQPHNPAIHIMPQDMGAEVGAGECRVAGPGLVLADDPGDAAAGELAAMLADEQRVVVVAGLVQAVLGQVGAQQRGGVIAERHVTG